MANLIRLPEVKKITGLSRAGIYRAVSLGEFPKQIPIGDRAVAWVEEEVREWVELKIQSARNAESENGHKRHHRGS